MAFRFNKKLTFIKIEKCAGTSVLDTLKDIPREQDCREHSTIKQIPNQWKDNTFTVVRNPYARAVSYFRFYKKKLKKKINQSPLVVKQLDIIDQGFEPFCCRYFHRTWNKWGDKRPWLDSYTKSQVRSIGRKFNGKILRLENIHQEWQWVQDQLGVNVPLSWINTSDQEYEYDWRSYYTVKAKDSIRRIWRLDLDILGYEW